MTAAGFSSPPKGGVGDSRTKERTESGYGHALCRALGKRGFGAADVDFPVVRADLTEQKVGISLAQIRRSMM
jgi:hypothetical protein